ncbi:hypothetical protein, partial [Escherichia coli]
MDMYSASNHKKYAYNWMEPFAQKTISERTVIKKTPTVNEIVEGTREIIINELGSSNDPNIINIKYEEEAPFVLDKDDEMIDLTGTVLPSNYNCPIYKNKNFKIFSPVDCLIIKHHKSEAIE